MRTFKDEDYKITFDDREYLTDILDDYDITPEELCYQMTAYEKSGTIDYEKGIRDILSDFSNDAPTAEDFYLYLEDNKYDMIYDIEYFDDLESGEKPFDICKKTFYGNFNPGYHKYFTYDGYGNYKGYEDIQEAMDEYGDEFKEWYYTNKYEDLLSDDEFKSQIVSGTLQLVKQGY